MLYNIALFGAYDISSFGDSMFPKAIYEELSKIIDIKEIVMFSPIGKINAYNDNGVVYSYSQFETVHKEKGFHAIIIGGGELLHNRPIIFSNNEQEIVYEAGELWKEPVKYGIKYDIPIILNSVGMPYDFCEDEREEITVLLEAAAYISLRDEYSYKRFVNYFGENKKIVLVPDSLWCMKDYFHAESLDIARKAIMEKYGFSKGLQYCILQYGTLKEYLEFATTVKMFCKNKNMQMVVFPINACHEDFSVVQRLKIDDLSDVILISETLSPLEIVSLISGASIFCGTSLHGNLAASTYHVKNVIIDMYPNFVSKMDGMHKMLGAPHNFVSNSEELWYVLNNIENCAVNGEQVEQCRGGVKKHFTQIANVITSEHSISKDKFNRKRMDKSRFNKYYVEILRRNEIVKVLKFITIEDDRKFKLEFSIKNLNETFILKIPLVTESEEILLEFQKEIKAISTNAISNHYYVGDFAEIACEILEPINKIFIKGERNKASINIFSEELLKKYRNQALHVKMLLGKERLAHEENKLLVDELDELKKNIFVSKKKLETVQTELENIKAAKAFKITRAMCSTLDGILYIPRWIGKRVAAFIKMMGHVNIQELKIAWGYLRREGVVGAYRHLMSDYHKGETKNVIVNINEKVFKKINSLDQCGEIELPIVKQPLVSIIIPVFNQFTYTYYCLKSILDNSGDVLYEVILADDCSSDLTADIEKVVKNLRIIKTQSNMLFLKNCNHAAEAARGKYILFLNNDTQVQKNWLRPLVDLCENDSNIGLTGSKLIYSDGTLQEAGGIIWKDATGWNYGRDTNETWAEYNYVKDVDYISGASLMIRTSLWKQLGGFDEYFVPAYYEDTDLAFQVRQAGYRVVYQPLSVVVHFEGKSNGTDLSNGIKKYQIENQRKFKKKWKEVLCEQLNNGQDVYLAKDRGQFRKQILVVDHYVPQYDKDAGGRCTYMYLKLFVKLGFKVTFIGDNFFKHEPYTTELNQMGIEVLYGDHYFKHWQEWMKLNLHYFDYIYLQRPHISIKYIDIVKKYARGKVFYFAHDLHFLRLTREYELNHDPLVLEEAERFKKDEFYLFSQSDVIHVVGNFEQEVLQQKLPEKVIRNIPLYIYEKLPEKINKDFSMRENILFVGGFGHSPNIDAVLWFAKEIFPIILKAYPDLVWHIVGGKAPKEIVELASENIVIDGFLSDADLDLMYRNCRLAVVPLRVGAGVKGKVVEAAYYQIPLITTNIGAEGISREEGAFQVEDDPKKMASLIIDTYTNYDKLRQMSDGGVQLIQNHYTLDEAERILKQDL